MRASAWTWGGAFAWLSVAVFLAGCLSRPTSISLLGHGGGTGWQARQSHLLQHERFSQAALLAGAHDLDHRAPVRSFEQAPLRPSSHVELAHVSPEPASQSSWTENPVFARDASQQESSTTAFDGTSHVQMGWRFLIHGNYEGAIAAYREALRQNDRLPQAFLGLGVALRVQGKMDAAKSALQRAVALAPRYAAALVHLGYWYVDNPTGRDDYNKARHLFRRASELGDPFAAIALRDLAARERT